jgi:hypothetical protein
MALLDLLDPARAEGDDSRSETSLDVRLEDVVVAPRSSSSSLSDGASSLAAQALQTVHRSDVSLRSAQEARRRTNGDNEAAR